MMFYDFAKFNQAITTAAKDQNPACDNSMLTMRMVGFNSCSHERIMLSSVF